MTNAHVIGGHKIIIQIACHLMFRLYMYIHVDVSPQSRFPVAVFSRSRVVTYTVKL